MKISAKQRRLLARTWRDYPVTFGIIFAAAALYLAVSSYAYSSPEHGEEAKRVFGASSQLIVLEPTRPSGVYEQIPHLVGPFDLWNGQWWRVPISGLHHGGLIHLVLNCVAIGFMGYLLEPRMRRSTYFLFFLTATTVSLLPEYLLEKSAVGLSGAAYGMFGLLLVLRRRDPRVAEVFHDGFVRAGLVWLFVCVFLTAAKILAIANFAHFVGCGYGLAAGRILFGETSASRRYQVAFYGAHLLIVPAL
jgi:membrane associated rhomboid family serine protease